MKAEAPDYHNPEFDEFADDYDAALRRGLSISGESKEFFAKGRVLWLGDCLRALGHRPCRILDFGCGTGSSTPYLLGLPGAESLLGVEVSPVSIKVARREYGSEQARFQLSSEHPPLKGFDLGFCNGVFHHIPREGRMGAVRYIIESLRPGGLFAIWENNPWNPGTRYVMGRIPFDKNAVPLSCPETQRLLTNGGFEIVRRDFHFLFPRALKLLRPLETLVRGWPLGAQYQVLARKPQ